MKSARIRSFSGLYFPANTGKYGPEKLRIRTLFVQWYYCHFKKDTKCCMTRQYLITKSNFIKSKLKNGLETLHIPYALV